MRKTSLVLGVVAALVVVALYATRVRTPPIRDDDGRLIPGSVASLEQVTLGSLDQYVLIRGHDAGNPILLFLHGGPGMPMMYLAHAFQRELERDFLVVHWDQRGAGKSYSEDVPAESLNVEQLLSDTRELVEALRSRYAAEKIYLAGHSFGSYLGILFAARHPELLHAYIGIGQVVDEERAAEIQDEFIRVTARERGTEEALQELEEKGAGARERWLFELGGELYQHTSWMPLLWTGLRAPEYSLHDAMNVGKGSSFSSRHMQYNAISGPLIDQVTTVAVPVYFFSGRHDYTTPFELVEMYYERLEAPAKRIVWFDDSAHFPFFEEPERFAAEMRAVLAEP
ncbi:MAG: alpha/beta hydrolase [Gemmatimonadota bacterium]|nr:MAG: alpha/beta hydrolase [Gemmatimonadota bacterium]